MENTTLRTTLKVFSIIAVVLGALSLIDGLVNADGYALLGGALFLTEGWLALVYISKVK
jgi:hypothetical protein